MEGWGGVMRKNNGGLVNKRCWGRGRVFLGGGNLTGIVMWEMIDGKVVWGVGKWEVGVFVRDFGNG